MKAMHFEQAGRWASGACILAASLWLVGCSSVDLGEKKPAPVESRTPTKVTPGAGGTGTGTAGGTSQSQVANVDLTKGDAAAGKPSNVIYFDFDSYAVKDEFRPTVEAYAKALVADRKKHLSVEGHTDERGGREYNLALGQKRAESVVKSLALLGAADNQLEAVSFGKERPAAQGNDEAAWAKNRRAELVYR